VLHGVFQIIEKALGLQKYEKKDALRVVRIFITFLLVTFAWIFFRMPTIGEAWDVVVKIFTDVPSSIYKGNNTNTVLSVAAIAIVLLKDWMEEFTSFSLFHNRYVVVRWASYLTVLFLILLFGVLDSSSFIYASF
jgi:alginate O-acetyltransferase complex protein AlgI